MSTDKPLSKHRVQIVFYISIVIVIVALGVTNIDVVGKKSIRNIEIENQVKDIILELKRSRSELSNIELPNLASGKLCFQGPYATKSAFEQAIGRIVDGFEPILDDKYIWWIFGAKGNNYWIEIPRVSVADKDQSLNDSCFDLELYRLTLKCTTSCIYSMRTK